MAEQVGMRSEVVDDEPRQVTPAADRDAEVSTGASPQLRNQRGQTLRNKGLRTRQRIVAALLALLDAGGSRELTAAEVARAADMSTASFYSYFRDVTEVLLVAAEQALEAAPDLSDIMGVPWTGPAAPGAVREMIDRLVEHSIGHFAVVHLRNNLADGGDPRFAAIRSAEAGAILDRLSRQIATGGTLDERRSGTDLEAAFAPASLIYGMVGRIAALLVQQPYARVADRAKLVDAATRIVLSVVHGVAAL